MSLHVPLEEFAFLLCLYGLTDKEVNSYIRGETTMLRNFLKLAFLIVIASAILPAFAIAEIAPAARAEVSADAAPEALQPIFEKLKIGKNEVSIPGAQWLQLSFTNFELGEQGKITVSAGDSHQDLTQNMLEQFKGSTVIFNGDKLTVTLEGEGVKASFGKVVVGLPTQPESNILLESEGAVVAPAELQAIFGGQLRNFIITDEKAQKQKPSGPDVGEPESICFGDDRVAANDPRVGRIMPIGCTGWLVDDGQILTAGHCIGTGTQVLQFKVPPSLADGTTVAPGANDQYIIDQSSIVSSGNNTQIGNDWATLKVFANTQTGQMPQQAQGDAFRLSNTSAPANVTITGYGVDGPGPGFGRRPPRNSDNQTLQTDSGEVKSHEPSSANNSTIRYQADSQGGNSGGPVIDKANPGIAVGIHTNAGCTGGGGANQGTSFRNQALWASVNTSFDGYSFFFGDFNGDGQTDYMALYTREGNRRKGNDRSIWLSNGDGTFGPRIVDSANTGTHFDGYSFFLGDFNGDKRTDYMALYTKEGDRRKGNDRSIWLSNGDGTFGERIVNSANTGTHFDGYSFFLGDFNGDRRTDYMALYTKEGDRRKGNDRSIWLSNGDGTFGERIVNPANTGTN